MRVRYLLIALIAVCLVTATACGSEDSTSETTNASTQQTDTAAATQRDQKAQAAKRKQLREQKAEAAKRKRQAAKARRARAAKRQRERRRKRAALRAKRERERRVAEEEQQQQQCHPNYDPCLDPNASDYDCEGGSGDGPKYTGPVTIKGGSDPYDLDRDGDGTGCDS